MVTTKTTQISIQCASTNYTSNGCINEEPRENPRMPLITTPLQPQLFEEMTHCLVVPQHRVGGLITELLQEPTKHKRI